MSTENQAPEPRRPILAVNYPKVTAAPEVRWLDSQYYSGAIVDFGDAQMHIFSPEQADSLIEAFTQARALFAAHEPPLIAPAEDVSMALAEHTQPALDAIEQAAAVTHRPRTWAETKLPTPTEYQDMHLDVCPQTGSYFLYMGNDYVAFTPDEWAEFLKALSAPRPQALAEHTQPAIEAIEQAAKPPHFIDEQGYCAACDWELKASVQADPFAGIPNSSDEENRPL